MQPLDAWSKHPREEAVQVYPLGTQWLLETHVAGGGLTD